MFKTIPDKNYIIRLKEFVNKPSDNESELLLKRNFETSYSHKIYSCYVCKNKEFLLLSNLDKNNIFVNYSICKSCGLVQLNPRLSDRSYSDFYKNLYMQLWEKKTKNELVPRNNYFITKQYPIIKQFLTHGDNVLEVGCNTGGVLKFLTDSGYNTYGNCNYSKC